MMNKTLSDYAFYVTDRIPVKNLTSKTFVGVDNMLPNRGGITESEYIPFDGTATNFKKGDILIGNIRPYFKKIWLAEFEGGCSNDVLCIRTKGEVPPQFLYAVLSQDSFFKYDMVGSKGSKMPRGDSNHVMRYPIVINKNMEEIGNFVVNLYKKIVYNNQINSALESMAKTLYDYWFLQFEFPNTEGKPYKSSGGKMVYNEQLKKEIPEGWEVNRLNHSKLLKNIKTGINRYDNTKTYLATSDVEGNKILEGSIITYNNREGRANMQPIKNSVWFAKMKNSIKHVVFPTNSKWMIDKYILSTGFTGFACNDNSLCYVWSYINNPLFEKTKDYRASGSTQESMSDDDLILFDILEPSDIVLDKYNEKVLPLIEEQNSIIHENQELSSLRDFLLPLLMNGQVTFKEKDEKIKNNNTVSFERFNQWKQSQGYAARGDVDDETLKIIFDAMEEDVTK